MKVKPKLLIVSQHFYPELISTGQTITELAENLAEKGVQCEVWCGYPTTIKRKEKISKIIDYKDITIRRVFSTRFPKLHLPGRLLNQTMFVLSVFLKLLMDRSRRPVLVLTSPPFLGIACAFNRLFGGNPYIYLVFDVFPDVAINVGMLKPGSLPVKIWNKMNSFIFFYASYIVVIGRCMRERIEAKLADKKKASVHLLPMWTDAAAIRPVARSMNSFIQKWDLEDKFVVGYFGNMGKSHNIETIILAASILRDQSDIEFLFVSEGYKKQKTIDRISELGLENCQFRSYVERDQLSYSLSCADIGLVSLENGHQGLSVPSKTFAMMAVHIPVVAIMPESSEIALMIREEKCGFVVEPGDAEELAHTILSIKEDENSRHELGSNARSAISKKYDVRITTCPYFGLILKMQ